MSATDATQQEMELGLRYDAMNPSWAWNKVLQALSELYHSYYQYGPMDSTVLDGLIQDDLEALMKAYNDWLN